MESGTVKWFNNLQGYGFISPDEGGRDIFVHYSSVKTTEKTRLDEGQLVNYTSVDGPKGPEALNVTLQPNKR